MQFTIGEGFFLKKHKTILGDTIAQELTQEQKQILHDVLTRRNAAGNSFIEELKGVIDSNINLLLELCLLSTTHLGLHSHVTE